MDYESTNSDKHPRYVQENPQAALFTSQTRADAVGGRADQRVFVNHQLSAPRDGSQAMRSQTGRHTKDGADTTTGGPDLQVQIKQTTPVDCDLGYGREKHPRLWDRKQGAVGGEGPSTEHIQLELVNARSVVNNVEEV